MSARDAMNRIYNESLLAAAEARIKRLEDAIRNIHNLHPHAKLGFPPLHDAIDRAYHGLVEQDRLVGEAPACDIDTMLRYLDKEMRRKLDLAANQAKDEWRGTHPHTLFVLLLREVDELRDELAMAFHIAQIGLYPDQYHGVLSECADVANYAAMIADVCRRLTDFPDPAKKEE